MNGIKISIIVPVWNAADRIRRCLDSLLLQTMTNIEVICVVDCPTDGTDKIVEEYAKKDSRVVVVKNETNMHVSASRNRGLDVARGEYIGFSDHDDYREDMKMYETLYRKAKANDADIVLSDATVIFEDRHIEHWTFTATSKTELISANILPFAQSVNPQIITHCVWHSIYRRELLLKHSIRFKERSIYMDEDRLFNFEAYKSSDVISYIKQQFYVWDKKENSVSNKRNYNIAERQIRRTLYYLHRLSESNELVRYLPELKTSIIWEIRSNRHDYYCLSKYHRKQIDTIFRLSSITFRDFFQGLGLLNARMFLFYILVRFSFLV